MKFINFEQCLIYYLIQHCYEGYVARWNGPSRTFVWLGGKIFF